MFYFVIFNPTDGEDVVQTPDDVLESLRMESHLVLKRQNYIQHLLPSGNV